MAREEEAGANERADGIDQELGSQDNWGNCFPRLQRFLAWKCGRIEGRRACWRV